MLEILELIEIFIEKGGAVLYALFFLTFILWMMLSERFIYIIFLAKELKKSLIIENKYFKDIDGWKIAKIREYSINIYALSLRDNVSIIKTLIIIAPFLGLLGTVSGMIEIFDVMAHTGSSDAKSMASGVGMATIPTLAGMVISISGVFFINLYNNRVTLEIQNLRENL